MSDFKKDLQKLSFDEYVEGEVTPWEEYMDQLYEMDIAQFCSCGGFGGCFRRCGGNCGECFRRCGGGFRRCGGNCGSCFRRCGGGCGGCF